MTSRFPMRSNPTGWYRVAGSQEVSRDPVVARYFGKNLLLARDESGAAEVRIAGGMRLPVREKAGMVVAYWCDDSDDAPAWEPPEVPEMGHASARTAWSACEEHAFVIRSHVQEIAENVVDPAHFH